MEKLLWFLISVLAIFLGVRWAIQPLIREKVAPGDRYYLDWLVNIGVFNSQEDTDLCEEFIKLKEAKRNYQRLSKLLLEFREMGLLTDVTLEEKQAILDKQFNT